MHSKHNAQLTQNARRLRREMTPEERHLWYEYLRSYPVRFYRQKVLGYYIVDFYCAKAALVVELDGSQHYEDHGLEIDHIRTAFLKEYGLTVLRFSNHDVRESFSAVCETIDTAIREKLGDDFPEE